MGDMTPHFNGAIFRQDHPQILACQRHLATIIPTMFTQSGSGMLEAGTVVARNSVSGFYEEYDNGASSGLDTAVGVTLDDLDFPAATGGTKALRVCVGGRVYKDKLTGLDANAETDLKARTVVDGMGNEILIF